MTKKAVKTVRRVKKDAPQRGRPSASLIGDAVIGRRVPRGLHPKWWRCDDVRERMIPREHGGGHVVEYLWVSRCTCGARMEEWKQYTLPPVSGHRLPAKCDACNDRVTGRDVADGADIGIPISPVSADNDQEIAPAVAAVETDAELLKRVRLAMSRPTRESVELHCANLEPDAWSDYVKVAMLTFVKQRRHTYIPDNILAVLNEVANG